MHVDMGTNYSCSRLGVIFVEADGWLIAQVMQSGGTDNLVTDGDFLALGVGLCILSGVGKLLQRRLSDCKS